jgi:hypothetical protein
MFLMASVRSEIALLRASPQNAEYDNLEKGL